MSHRGITCEITERQPRQAGLRGAAPEGLEGQAAVPVGSGRPATGDSDDAEATQHSPTKNRAGPLPVQDSPCTSHTAPLPVQNSPSTLLLTAYAVQNSPCSPKMALFGTFFACMANFLPFSPARSRAWRTLYRICQQETTLGRSRYKIRPAHPSSPARHRRDRRTRLRCPWTAPTPPPTKFRMQFDWKKFQQCLKTLQFQRC